MSGIPPVFYMTSALWGCCPKRWQRRREGMRGDQRAWREEQEETREAAHVEKEQDRYFFIFNNKPHIQPHHLFDGEDSLDEEKKPEIITNINFC